VWGESISSGTVPWQGQEAITAKENLEELIMLGLRLHEGLDLNRIDRAMREPDGDNAIGSVHANYSNMDNIASADSVTLSTANNHNDFALRRTRIAKLADDGLLTIHGKPRGPHPARPPAQRLPHRAVLRHGRPITFGSHFLQRPEKV
jgi:oxygen-independent coproporphyrinogen-3 oxidase